MNNFYDVKHIRGNGVIVHEIHPRGHKGFTQFFINIAIIPMLGIL